MGLGLGLSVTSSSYVDSFVDPSSVSDLSLWLDNGVGVTGAQWNDSSGNNNHITQSTGGEQATATDGGLDFEGNNNDHYDLTTGIDLGGSNPFTIFVVLKIESFDPYPSDGTSTQNTLLGVSGSANDSTSGENSVFYNFTANIEDDTNQFGQYVSIFSEQSKEDRDNKIKRSYHGNGAVVWTDGSIVKAENKNSKNSVIDNNDLPF